jgi:hypothetical protein
MNKLNSTVNNNFNFLSQNESPLIKLVKDPQQLAKSVMSTGSQSNQLATNDSLHNNTQINIIDGHESVSNS